jgi:hypothetical protein
MEYEGVDVAIMRHPRETAMLDEIRKLQAEIHRVMAKMSPPQAKFYQHHDIDESRCGHCNAIVGGSLIVALAGADVSLDNLADAIGEHMVRADALVGGRVNA